MTTPQEQEILAKFNGWGTVKTAFTSDRDWEAELAQLKEILTEEEYNDAASATRNAFYTEPSIIKTMWAGLERMGFKGGRILDPSMGSGRFYQFMPQTIAANSILHGVEKDSITGRIAAQLFQNGNVQVSPFEKATQPNDFYDLAISNVPFGSTVIYDKAYEKTSAGTRNPGYRIHNYFFAKAMDKVRPSGFVMFITGPGTMQTGSREATLLRSELAGKADLVAAFKLPGETFLKDAGTQVTTDIIILRKREKGEKPADYAEKWTDTKNVPMDFKPDTSKPSPTYSTRANPDTVELPLNEYYVKHPANMIGTLVTDTLYGADDRWGLTIKKGDKNIEPKDYVNVVSKELEKRMAKLPENIYTKSKTRTHDGVKATQQFLSATGEREKAFVVKDGKAYQNRGGELVPVASKDDGKVKHGRFINFFKRNKQYIEKNNLT